MIWGGFLIVVLWMIGKLVGWISSPVWVELLPLFGLLVATAGISVKIGRTFEKIDNIAKSITRIESDMKNTKRRVSATESSITDLNARVGA